MVLIFVGTHSCNDKKRKRLIEVFLKSSKLTKRDIEETGGIQKNRKSYHGLEFETIKK